MTGFEVEDADLIVRTPATGQVEHLAIDRPLRLPGQLTLPQGALQNSSELRHLLVRVQARDARGGRWSLGAEAELSGAVTGLAAGFQLATVCSPTECVQPASRVGAVMAGDPRRERLFLFGGRSALGRPLADAWEWDGLRWTALPAPVGAPWPAARSDASLAYDESRGTLVLYGGRDENGPLGDTWEYDGAGFRKLAEDGSGPSRRSQAAVSPYQGGLLLFGGRGVQDEFLGDTWQFHDGAWQIRKSPAAACDPASTGPRCRAGAGLVEDPAGAVLLIAGHLGNVLHPESDELIWRFAGAEWEPAAISRPPAVLGRGGYGLLALGTRPTGTSGAPSASEGPQALLAFGAAPDGWVRKDCYVLDFASGQFAPQLGVAPPARVGAAMAYDAARDEVIAASGRSDLDTNLAISGEPLLDDVWAFVRDRGWRRLR